MKLIIHQINLLKNKHHMKHQHNNKNNNKFLLIIILQVFQQLIKNIHQVQYQKENHFIKQIIQLHKVLNHLNKKIILINQ